MTAVDMSSRFSRGGAAAVSEDEALSVARGGSASYRKTNYLPKIGKDKHIFVRYLLDSHEWYYTMTHSFVPTKGAPNDWPKDRKFPASMPSVCRYDKMFKADPERGLSAVYEDCYICDAKVKNQWDNECKPSVRVWTLAVIREEVIGTDDMVAQGIITADQVGRRVGFRDATREVEVPVRDDKGEVVKKDGKTVMETITEPAIIVVNQAVNNFFEGLQAIYGMFGTVCDRDFILRQNDEGKDVDFQHMNLDETPNHKPGTESWKRYEEAIKAQGDSVNIEKIIMERSSDEYYATFFDPTKEAPKRDTSGDGGSSSNGTSAPTGAPAAQQNSAPSNEPASADALAAMRARVRGQQAPAQGDSPAPTAGGQDTPQSTPASQPAGALDFS